MFTENGLNKRYNPCLSTGYTLLSEAIEHLKIRHVSTTLDLPLLYYAIQIGDKLHIKHVMRHMKCPQCNCNLLNFRNAKEHFRNHFDGSGLMINLGIDILIIVYSFHESKTYFSCTRAMEVKNNCQIIYFDIPSQKEVNPVYNYMSHLHTHQAWSHAMEHFTNSSESQNFSSDSNAFVLHLYSVSMDLILHQIKIPTIRTASQFLFTILTCSLSSILIELNLTKYFKLLLVDIYSKQIIDEHTLLLCISILTETKLTILEDKELLRPTELIPQVPLTFKTRQSEHRYSMVIKDPRN